MPALENSNGPRRKLGVTYNAKGSRAVWRSHHEPEETMNKVLLTLSLMAAPLAAQTCALADNPALTIVQSAALQSCIDSAPDYSTVSISMAQFQGRMPHVRLDRTIRVNGRYNLAIECSGGHTMSAGAPGFYWGGLDGATVLNTSGSSAVRIEHCNFFSGLTVNAGGTGGAYILIEGDISSTVSSNVTTTDHTYNDLGLSANGMNPNFTAIRFSASGDANVEAMRVTNSRIQCSTTTDGNAVVGYGIYIAGYTFDALRHRYGDNKIQYCDQAIRALYGLPDIGNNHFQTNKVCVQALASPIRIHDNDSENCGQFFTGEGNTIIIESNRIAACRPPAGQGCIDTAGAVISRGNLFNALTGIPIRSSSNVRQLISEGDVFPDYDQFLKGAATFYQFEAKAMNWAFGISVMGGNQGGNATVFDCNHGNNELKAAGVFVLCADGSLRQLQLSQDGQSFKSVMP